MRSRHPLACGAVALALTAAGCGRDAQLYESAPALARAAECSGYEATGSSELVESSGTCSVGAGAAQLFTFANSTARDKWLTLGATIGPVVVGPNWAIVAPSDASAEEIASTTGGAAR